MSKLLIVEIPESESAHLTALGFVMNTWELPTAEELGRAALDDLHKYDQSNVERTVEEIEQSLGNAILDAIRRKP